MRGVCEMGMRWVLEGCERGVRGGEMGERGGVKWVLEGCERGV